MIAAIAAAIVGGSPEQIRIAQMNASIAVTNNFCGLNGCVDRRFTWNDAVEQWRNGKGAPVTDVQASELNLTDATFVKTGEDKYLVSTSLKFDTGAIYGTVTGYLNPDGTMRFAPDSYNFDIKGYGDSTTLAHAFGRTGRNLATAAGLVINGAGQQYLINFTGAIPAPKNLPK